MSTIASIKTPLLCLILAVAYSDMVINIIQITKVRTGENTYPPAVVAMLVVSILQMLYMLYVLATSGKGKINKASNVAGATILFLLFNFGAIVAVTVLRYQARYCGPDNTIRSDCAGVLKGTMGLGWSLIGLDLIYLGVLASLVSNFGKWSDPLHELPPTRIPRHDVEKAPAH